MTDDASTPSFPLAGLSSGGPLPAVRGTVRIEQVVVGDQGPSVEPRPTADRFRSVPFRPDTMLDGWSTRAATVRAVSLRGHLHRYDGAPRQDDVAVHAAPSGRIIAVVADGVSAALHAHIGASTATTVAVQWLLSEAPEVGARIAWLELVRAISWQMTERARSVLGGEIDGEDVERGFATTMVAAVIDPNPDGVLEVEAIGVGDSSGWILRDGEFVPLLGGKNDGAGGLASSAVVGLPRTPSSITPVSAVLYPDDVLLLGSDGVGDPLGSGQGGVGDLLRAVLGSTVPSMMEFGNAVDFSRETFDDDRSLVAVWPTRPALGRGRKNLNGIGD
ncbi:protein phosphatase 2C domain-containing protein [Tsukamurella spumae]|uniref:Protein phosphatase 2C domain-containing protein n=1 Tax=Tsukamurella spumae TaxID=44753 RepID=A0A846WZF2_9ACTN|nr:protein phosphatase 2C domain-containing protein [Tsukamurella spumae]NKY17469.1 protein phosphatase 2C domain-containing protein [Tsukamurella spumae]